MVKGQVLLPSKALQYKRAINNIPGQFFIHIVNKKDSHVATEGLKPQIDHFTEGFVTKLYTAIFYGTKVQR